MHTIEPFYRWRGFYIASDDELSPFFNREYSEFEFTNKIYNYLIHPQWDDIGSETLFIKILFTDYKEGFCIIELIGEWNDAIGNDIMIFKRDIADEIMRYGINKFILIAENILNFHSSDDSYYEEWFEDVGDGWISILNLRKHVLHDMRKSNIDSYIIMDGTLNSFNWRTHSPQSLFKSVSEIVNNRLT